MSENTVVTPKTGQEMYEVSKTITMALNGIMVGEAIRLLKSIEERILNDSAIVSFDKE